MLLIAFLVPATVILGLFWYLPQVQEGNLQAEVRLENVPPAEFYKLDFEERPKVDRGIIAVENLGQEEWTNFYIRINKAYSINDKDPIPAGETRRYRLDKFISKFGGAPLDIQLVQVTNVEVYARVTSGARHTYDKNFAE